MSAMPMTAETGEAEGVFDFSARVFEMRCHPNDVLRDKVKAARREQQRWRLEELAATRVLDEREALGDTPDPTLSTRTVQSHLEVARALESMPQVAAKAHTGELTWDQLQPLAELATPDTDKEWARRGPNLSPVDLQRMARRAHKVTPADAEARHQARELRTWRPSAAGMGGGRWSLPDVESVLVDKVFAHMAERMRPKKGERWDSLAHRKADALVELCRTYADLEPTGKFRVEIVNIIDPQARAVGPTVEGVPIASETLRALVPQAKIRDCVVDDTGVPRTTKQPRAPLPADVERHIRRRDEQCRTPGCEATEGLQIHHCDAIVDHGESFDVRRLAAVCDHDHHLSSRTAHIGSSATPKNPTASASCTATTSPAGHELNRAR